MKKIFTRYMLFAIAMILFPKSYCYAQTSSVSLEKQMSMVIKVSISLILSL